MVGIGFVGFVFGFALLVFVVVVFGFVVFVAR